jgi:Fe-S oxidoreductase
LMVLAKEIEKLREWVSRESSKCMSCGFCEALCPTLPLGPHRAYGPRGRVRLAGIAAGGGLHSREAIMGLYTCLLCALCVRRCPAHIDIPGLVRAARSLLMAKVSRRSEPLARRGVE